MHTTEFQRYREQQRSNRVRMRTLVTLRWFAVLGQAAAIFAAVFLYDLKIQALSALAIIALSAAANLFCRIRYLANKRLSEREAAFWLVFDILQLSLLLYLTGGLNNPFAMLLLVPVTIAATVLRLQTVIFLGAVALGAVTLLSRYNLPILLANGTALQLPGILQFGFWIALLIGVVFLALYARQVTTEMNAMGEALVATQLALAREQKLTDLGGVVAAAAHELGTPLATIKLVSSELMDDLDDRPDSLEDVKLIREQAERCREILHSMGRAGKDDLHLRHAPFETVVREAAEPHLQRGKAVNFILQPDAPFVRAQPSILRRPEIIHGLRNLVQNAVDFSRSEVRIILRWTEEEITVQIADDGKGFPPSVIGKIGDPYVRRRRYFEDGAKRPGYEGMGLGLFIAKTLLERSGAQLEFANSRDTGQKTSAHTIGGAVVTATWSRNALEDIAAGQSTPLGENKRFETWP